MKNIIAFAASNSKNSINKTFASYVGTQIGNSNLEVLDLNDYELPMFSIEHEQESGIPQKAKDFLHKIQIADAIVISFAEHNGAYSAVFKNLFDWMSRIDGKLWNGVPMLLLATSPGARGGATVLNIAKDRFPYMGGNIVGTFSLPSFNENFQNGTVVNDALKNDLTKEIKALENSL